MKDYTLYIYIYISYISHIIYTLYTYSSFVECSHRFNAHRVK